MLTHISFFAGIGGLDEGARRAGIRTTEAIEFEKNRYQVLLKHNPTVNISNDIREYNASHISRIKNVIFSGGFPCQDISLAGKKAGIFGSRSSLWGEYGRCIGEGRPNYAIIENSPQLLNRGLEKVLFDLSEIGYDAEWECISASAFGMPHGRRRLFIIAYPQEIGRKRILLRGNQGIFKQIEKTNALDSRRYPFLQFEQSVGQPAVFGMDDGFPGRSHLVERLAGCGNAVSPVIAEYLFHCIIQDHKNLNNVIL